MHAGYFDSPMLRKAMSRFADAAEALRRDDALQLRHLAIPTTIAYRGLYLAFDESKFFTGSALVIDRSYTAR